MQVRCPIPGCRSDNDVQAERCHRCGSPLIQYANLSVYPAQLFNRGLAAATSGQVALARDYFSAVVNWCPMDKEARNALAMACLAMGDLEAARNHWQTVIDHAPKDPVATQGLVALEQFKKAPQTSPFKVGTKPKARAVGSKTKGGKKSVRKRKRKNKK